MAHSPVQTGDFSQGGIRANILRLAVPMVLAQLASVLYNIVDRIYLGHMPGASSAALAGVGLTFPILQIITAFASLFGSGGTPLFSMARGRGDDREAAHILNVVFSLLVSVGAALTVLFLLLRRPLLYLLGASDATYPYASQYLAVYLTGSVFVMLSLGLNGFINAQGFGRTGMMTVVIGAGLNLVLDPILIFGFGLGVQGAALATVISQFFGALWAVLFLTSRRASVRLEPFRFCFPPVLIRRICGLGMSGFVMSVTNCAVQAVCNMALQQYGGDLYISVMTIVNSMREIAITPANAASQAGQPVMSYNYGAQQYARVRAAIRFVTLLCVGYTLAVWGLLMAFPAQCAALFSSDARLIAVGTPAMRVYFCGIFLMALQMAGQAPAVALGRARQAVFFSLLRKAFIVVPLTLLLPRLGGLGVMGVFLAEPVSNLIGGAACYLTMALTIGRELRRKEQASLAGAVPQAETSKATTGPV